MDTSEFLTVKIERELRQGRQWLGATLQSIGHGVIASDRRGCIKFMNRAAEALTGWNQAEALGQPTEKVVALVNSKTRQPVTNPIDRVLQAGRAVEWEDNILLIAKSKVEIAIDHNTTPIRDDRGHLSGVVFVFRDITEQKQADEKLRQFVLELQAQNTELDALAHTLAHNLKSPLNPVIGFAEILLSNHATLSTVELEEFLEIIARNGRKMANLIDELLLFR